MLKTIEYDKDTIYSSKNESIVRLDKGMIGEEFGHKWRKEAYALKGINDYLTIKNQELNSKWGNKISPLMTVFSIEREEDKFVKKKKSVETFLSNESLVIDSSLNNDLNDLVNKALIDPSKIKILRSSLTNEMQGIVLDVDLFKAMLSNHMAVQEATDEYMLEIASQRKDHRADIPLAKVIEELELDVCEIFSLVDTIEED